MLPVLHVYQLALKKWHGKIDCADGSIIALIRSMNPDDPHIAKHMKSGYILFNRHYFLEMIPLLDVAETQVGRRLRQLEKLGLVDLHTEVSKTTGRYTLYGRLSKLYWAEERRIQTDSPSTFKSTDKSVHGRLTQTPTAQKSIDHIKDHEEGESPAFSGGSSPEEEVTPEQALKNAELLKAKFNDSPW